jgi:heparan-alpha-glucosaminide N-acetyltransferase
MDDGSSNKVVEDVAEEDPGRRGGPWRTDEADANEKAPRPSRRVASLDVFRGLTVAVSSSSISSQGIERWGILILN